MHVKIKKAPGKKVAPWRLLGACTPFFTLAPLGVNNFQHSESMNLEGRYRAARAAKNKNDSPLR